MELKSQKSFYFLADTENNVLCNTDGEFCFMYLKKDLEYFKGILESTLKYYEENNINDDIIKFMNKKNTKERHDFHVAIFEKQEKSKKTKSGLYLISAGREYFKIGRTENITTRLTSLKIGNPYEMKVLFYIQGLGKCESSMHRYFSKFHVEGEWFKANQEIIDCFKIVEENKEILFNLNGKIDLDYYIKKVFKKKVKINH